MLFGVRGIVYFYVLAVGKRVVLLLAYNQSRVCLDEEEQCTI